MEAGTTDARIMHLVAHSDGISRTELATLLALPAPTIASAVRRLVVDGSLVEKMHEGPRYVAGRRPQLLFLPGRKRSIGIISWTPDRLELCLADYGARTLRRDSAELPVPGDDPMMFAPAVAQLVELASTARPRTDLSAVVITVPAPFQQGVGTAGQQLPVRRRSTRPTATAALGAAHFFAGLAGDPATPLSDSFDLSVYVENDANLAAMGEFSSGAGRGRPDQMYILLDGRSIGSGLIVGGRLVRGASGYAGELAHVQVDEAGPLCACGGRGCLGTRLGAGLLQTVQAAYRQQVTFDDVVAMAARGDAGPQRILYDIGRVVGRPLADVCTVLNPGLIVLDARLGTASQHVLKGLREQIERFTPPAIGASLDLVAGTLTEDAAVHGAIHLARTGR